MAYVQLHHHKSYALEVREFGDTGWAIHVYAPQTEKRATKVAIITTTLPDGLEEILANARLEFENDLKGSRPPNGGS